MNKRLLSLIAVLLLTFNMIGITVSALAFALDSEVVSTLNSYASSACEEIGIKDFEMVQIVDTEADDDKVYAVFNQDAYDVLSVVQKKEFIKSIVAKCKSADCVLNATQRQQAYNFLVSVDDSYINAAVADMLNTNNNNLLFAITKMEPVFRVLNLIFGFLVIVILLLTASVTILDICYMSLPISQTMSKDDKKPKFISNEAFKALQTSIETKENIYGLYFKKRVLSLILIFVCIAIIISGRLGDFVTTLVGMFV